jgi:hypothetical protein
VEERHREEGLTALLARRLAAPMLVGVLIASLAMVAFGWLLRLVGGVAHAPDAALAYRSFLAAGAWTWFPLWGGALGALAVAITSDSLAERFACLGVALLCALLPFVVQLEFSDANPDRVRPRTVEAKMRAVLRWSYRSPATVLRIVDMSRDPDPRVREQATLALGVNLIVTDIERATPDRPARYAASPVRDSLRRRLAVALVDPVEVVRAEAARALWKAPRCFGAAPAAAETLAALLDRGTRPGALERLSWLALDAAAGTPDPGLKRAAAHFAATVTDSELRQAAVQAAR